MTTGSAIPKQPSIRKKALSTTTEDRRRKLGDRLRQQFGSSTLFDMEIRLKVVSTIQSSKGIQQWNLPIM